MHLHITVMGPVLGEIANSSTFRRLDPEITSQARSERARSARRRGILSGSAKRSLPMPRAGRLGRNTCRVDRIRRRGDRMRLRCATPHRNDPGGAKAPVRGSRVLTGIDFTQTSSDPPRCGRNDRAGPVTWRPLPAAAGMLRGPRGSFTSV